MVLGLGDGAGSGEEGGVRGGGGYISSALTVENACCDSTYLFCIC